MFDACQRGGRVDSYCARLLPLKEPCQYLSVTNTHDAAYFEASHDVCELFVMVEYRAVVFVRRLNPYVLSV